MTIANNCIQSLVASCIELYSKSKSFQVKANHAIGPFTLKHPFSLDKLREIESHVHFLKKRLWVQWFKPLLFPRNESVCMFLLWFLSTLHISFTIFQHSYAVVAEFTSAATQCLANVLLSSQCSPSSNARDPRDASSLSSITQLRRPFVRQCRIRGLRQRSSAAAGIPWGTNSPWLQQFQPHWHELTNVDYLDLFRLVSPHENSTSKLVLSGVFHSGKMREEKRWHPVVTWLQLNAPFFRVPFLYPFLACMRSVKRAHLWRNAYNRSPSHPPSCKSFPTFQWTACKSSIHHCHGQLSDILTMAGKCS